MRLGLIRLCNFLGKRDAVCLGFFYEANQLAYLTEKATIGTQLRDRLFGLTR